jgi:uncharacterized protein YndB with AHSA1/START domain
MTTATQRVSGVVSMALASLWMGYMSPVLSQGKDQPATPVPTFRSIDLDVTIDAPIADVWQSWTTREGIIRFFAPDAVIEPRVGGLFEIHIDPTAPPGDKGADGMRYLALDAPRFLSFTWNAPPSLPVARQQRTVVMMRLTPVTDKRTRVDFRHVGWGEGGEWDKAYQYFNRAWPRVLANLQQSHEGKPMDWTQWLAQLREARAKREAQKTEAAK